MRGGLRALPHACVGTGALTACLAARLLHWQVSLLTRLLGCRGSEATELLAAAAGSEELERERQRACGGRGGGGG